MDQLSEFIIEIQQIFLGLVILGFSLSIYQERELIRSRVSSSTKKFLGLVLVCCAAGLTANFVEGLGQTGILYAIEFSLLITMSLLGPKYAVSLFIYMLLSRPWEVLDNALVESMPRDLFYLTIVVIFGYKLIKKDISIRFNLGSVILGFLTVWVFFSAFFSSNQVLAISKFGEIFMKGVIVFYLIQNGFEKGKDLIVAKLTVILAICEKSAISFYQAHLNSLKSLAVEDDQFQRLESVGILSNSNDIAAIFILAFPFILFFILKSKLKPLNWIFTIAAAGIMSYLVWKSQSRGAMLALVFTGASYFFLQIKSRKAVMTLIASAIILSFGSFALMKREAADLEGSTNNRIIFWKAGANMAVRNPVFGVGFWGFNENFAGYAIDGNTGTEGTHMTAHSSWVQILAETGFMGLFLFLSLWLYAMKRAYGIRSLEPEYFMSLVGYGVTISFLSHAYLLFPYILCALAITQASLNENRVKDEEEQIASLLLSRRVYAS